MKDKKLEEYQKYRYNLKQNEIGSFIDQNGRTYSVCGECVKKDCVSRRSGNGCMIGAVNGDVELKIKREGM